MPRNKLAIRSLVFSLVGFVMPSVPVLMLLIPGVAANPLMFVAFALALLAMIVFLIAGTVFGHLSLHGIKKNPARGRGFALAAVIIGYFGLGFSVLLSAPTWHSYF